MTVDVGDDAPDFALPTNGDSALSLEDLKGRKFVLYFYPKDDTPGCTKEACEFRDAKKEFAAAGVEIIGVSKDSVAKHDKFKSKYDLPFRLISDTDGALIEAVGSWVEKSMYGRKYMGIDRSTFLIDADGKVRQIWRKVKVKGHVDDVLSAAKEL